ncbi:MAG: hypothetical protein J0H00_10840 [Burkholderiales bacterium]|nr:hypothetical protein [Burkholderiales bacterium]
MGIENLLTADEIEAAKLADLDEDEIKEIENLAGEEDEDEEAGDDAEDGAAAGKDDAETKDGDAEEEDEDEGAAPRIEKTFAPNFSAGDPESFDDQLKTIREQRTALTKSWRAGEVEDADYDAKLAELDDQKDAVIEQRATAQAAITISRQTAKQAFDHDRENFLRAMEKYESVPYSKTPMLASAFAQELKAAGQRAIDEKRDPSAQDLFEEAHVRVLEQMRALGMTVAKKPKKEDGQQDSQGAKEPEAKAPRQVPRTLGGLPSAAPNGAMVDDLMSQAANLEGEDLEIFVARLPDDKRRALESAG